MKTWPFFQFPGSLFKISLKLKRGFVFLIQMQFMSANFFYLPFRYLPDLFSKKISLEKFKTQWCLFYLLKMSLQLKLKAFVIHSTCKEKLICSSLIVIFRLIEKSAIL